MKKLVFICMLILMMLFTLMGCSTESTASSDNEGGISTGKIVVNFEGKVTAVSDDRVTLENGQTVIISDDTVFSNASGVVENVILSVGDTIQGYTEDDPAASEVTASRIHIIAY